MYDRNHWSRNTGKGKSIKKSELTQMIFLYGFLITMIMAFILVVVR